ncbi:hypothetical protein PQS31_06100 [Luteimonas sp BLCC-B24]|uniref:hypothetical protein n=1 Tax=Luteimonas sp. BLCC-B24 TaxID=3025317 RepID=UPI00234C6748|nr:hypothetical protein [Luteimonas sp. BLCC-B24]MDC7806395.1 hypothetical protein [Luteimonas sp. BLCC-B24]
MSTPRRHGLAVHIADTTHGIGRPRARRRRRLAGWIRLALALVAVALVAWARTRF